MKFKLFIIIFIISFGFCLSQTQVKDTISGGSYNIITNPIIDSLVQKTTKAKCYKPNKTYETRTNSSDVIDPCSQSQKVMGYKIQVRYTKDRNTANKVRSEFARNFPSLVPEMVYTQPDYRVIAGDYFTKRSAASDLAAVKKYYPGAFLIQWRVWCRKAK